MPFGMIRAESQRDSAPKPRVASRELPWEKRVVSANPNGVVVRWRSGDTTPSVVPFGGTTTCATIRQMAQLQIVTFGTSFDAKWRYQRGCGAMAERGHIPVENRTDANPG